MHLTSLKQHSTTACLPTQPRHINQCIEILWQCFIKNIKHYLHHITKILYNMHQPMWHMDSHSFLHWNNIHSTITISILPKPIFIKLLYYITTNSKHLMKLLKYTKVMPNQSVKKRTLPNNQFLSITERSLTLSRTLQCCHIFEGVRPDFQLKHCYL